MTFRIAVVSDDAIHTLAETPSYERAEVRCLSEAPPSGLTMHIYAVNQDDRLVAVVTPDGQVAYQ